MNENEVGTVSVSVSHKAVSKAIHNILANEYKLDPIEIKNECKRQAEEVIKKEVIDYLKDYGFDKAQLEYRIKNAVDSKLTEIKTIAKEVIRELVHQHIREETESVIGGIIRDGLEIQIGYLRKAKVKIVKE